MGDPDFIVLCGSCVQKCIAQPVNEQPVIRTKKDIKTLKRVKDTTTE